MHKIKQLLLFLCSDNELLAGVKRFLNIFGLRLMPGKFHQVAVR